MIVEDEALLALSLEDMLADLGHRVIALTVDVSSSLDAIEREQSHLEGVLLDTNLGGESALPIAEALNAKGIPYLLCSGYGEKDLEALGFTASFLRKPYDQRQLLEALNRTFAKG